MYNTISIFGQPIEFWGELQSVMARYGITTPQELKAKLQLLTNKPSTRVEVYDVGNRDRLLGTVRKPNFNGSYVRMAVLPRLCAPQFDASIPPWEATVDYITMEANFKRGPNPLDVKGVLTTSDPLKTLMKVRDFRLPGESEMQAEQRRYSS